MNRQLLASLLGAACCCACTLITPHENLTGGSETPLGDGGTETPDADGGHEQVDGDGQVPDSNAEPMGEDGGETADGDASTPPDAGVVETGKSCDGVIGLCDDGDAAMSCCAVSVVEGGTFAMGRADAPPPEGPAHNASVSTFSLDVFEVTVGRFRTFHDAWFADHDLLADEAGAHPSFPGSGWRSEWNEHLDKGMKDLVGDSSNASWNPDAGGDDARPLNHASWYVAFAFCAWDGGYLPTEAEWEYAAAGGNLQRFWPWGDASPQGEHAVYCDGGTGACLLDPKVPVGQRPAGKGMFGQLDLGGSVFEWTLDVYDKSWYGDGGTCGTCANLDANPDADWDSDIRTIRGGSWYHGADGLHVAYRKGSRARGAEGNDIGFRCAHKYP